MSKPGAKPYKWVREPLHPNSTKKGFIQEHRLIAEQIVGRILKPEEVVHHKDGNTTNNTIDNLMVFASANDHSAFHAGRPIYEIDNVWHAEEKKPKEKVKCQMCGKMFIPKYGPQTFCSIKCKNKSSKKITNEIITEMQNLLRKNNGNFTKTATIIGITSSGIVRRLKRAKLPYHSSDYRSKSV